MLSCSCNDDYEWDKWYMPPSDFTKFNGARRKRCISCRELIDFNTDCIKFENYRSPTSDIEERIWGHEVQLADSYACEKCGEIFLNLEELGYCVNLGDNFIEALKEYWELTGFNGSAARGV